MKYFKNIGLLAVFMLAMSISAMAQNVTINPGGGSYATLQAAFAAINGGTHTGAVTVAIIGDTTEIATAVLNASGTGAASYTSILVTPNGTRSVSGAILAGSPLIDFNGADSVTINGLNTGGNSLTIANTTVSATSGTSTIRFIGDATNNIITRTNIQGASTMETTTNGGTIFFSTAITTGNDGNTFSLNNIGPVGANLPTKAIYSNGTIGLSTRYNSGNTFDNNNIFDFFNAAAQSNGFYLSTATTDWTITNNRLYQTATRTQTTGANHVGIEAASSTGNNNHNISFNTIGYSSDTQTGTYNFVGFSSFSKFLPIYFSSAGTTTPSSIQGNIITAINMSGTLAGTGSSSVFGGISIASGRPNIGTTTGNTIGSLTTAGAITINYTATEASDVHGICFLFGVAANISNNNVGGFAITNSATAANTAFYGVRALTAGTVTNTMQNNTIGSEAAPISVSSGATGSAVIGLYSQFGLPEVSGNIIRNITTNAPNVGNGTSASVKGLWIQSSAAVGGGIVERNTIHSLSNTNATAVAVTGFLYAGQTGATPANIVERNFVHSLRLSTSAPGIMRGIEITAGTTQFQNNMVRLGVDAAGIPVAGGYDIIGINEAAGTDNFYFNSVYIGGSAGTTAVSSYAFFSSVTNNTRNYKNNIFANNRSIDAGGGFNVAANYSGTLPNPAGLSSDYNIYFSQNTNAAIRNVVPTYSLASWKMDSGNQDVNSLQAPTIASIAFANPEGNAATVDLHITTTSIAKDAGTTIAAFVERAKGEGFILAPVANDFDGQARPNGPAPDIGGDEFVPASAAEASIGGRVMTADGQGIRNAVIMVTGTDMAEPIFVRTGSFGYYRVDGLAVGANYVVTVVSKRFTFSQPSRIIGLTDDITDVDFVADPQ